MNDTKAKLAMVAAVAVLAGVASAETWYWSPSVQSNGRYNWNANAFGDNDRAQGEKPKVMVNVTTGAALNLDYAGRIDCAEFRLDGEKVFGTFGAVGSGANHEYEWITGTGILRALPVGTTITFR